MQTDAILKARWSLMMEKDYYQILCSLEKSVCFSTFLITMSYYLFDTQVGEHLFCMLLSQRIREYHLGVFGFSILG